LQAIGSGLLALTGSPFSAGKRPMATPSSDYPQCRTLSIFIVPDRADHARTVADTHAACFQSSSAEI